MSYIVSSVLSEHDYSGRVRTTSSSSSSSSGSSSSNTSSNSGSNTSGSSSSSSDSGAALDVTEEDMERTEDIERTEEDIERTFQNLEDKLELPPLPVGEDTLKPLLLDLPLVERGAEEEVRTSPLEEKIEEEEKMEVEKEREEEKEKKIEEEKEKEKEREREREKERAQEEQEVELTPEQTVIKEWELIASSLGRMKTLQKIIIGTCDSVIVQIVLSRCHQLTSFNSLNLGNQAGNEVISFDPSFLMQTRKLEEFRLTSQKNFTLKSNFNFIKLPRLKVLMLKGLKTADIGWPYLGIHLTHLHLSSINTFSHNNWLNVSSMISLVELELDSGGSDHDIELCSTLSKLSSLKRLTLLDWNIGCKLPHTLKRLHNIKFLHIIPAVESQSMRGIFAGRLMVVLESAKHLVEFVWGIQPQSIIMDETAGEKIFILNMKGGKETGTIEGEEVRGVAIDSLKGFVRCRIPNTKITVRKVSENPWSWCAREWR